MPISQQNKMIKQRPTFLEGLFHDKILLYRSISSSTTIWGRNSYCPHFPDENKWSSKHEKSWPKVAQESGLSASNTSALSTGHRSPSKPTATPQVSTSSSLEQVYSHRERTPRTQGRENEVSPQPGAGNAGSPCCHGNRWHSHHRLPRPPISCNYSQGLCRSTFGHWHKVLLSVRQKRYPETEGGHSQAGQVTRKMLKPMQEGPCFLFCFVLVFLGDMVSIPVLPSGLEPH